MGDTLVLEQLLETLKPSYDRTKYSESLREAGNAAKNRNQKILPGTFI